MRPRVCSLETEYALVSNLIADSNDRQKLAERLIKAVLGEQPWAKCNSFGRRSPTSEGVRVERVEGYFIANGSRVYQDTGHIEWANPETITAQSGLVYEQAAEANLVRALDRVAVDLEQEQPDSWIMLVKNNIDYWGGRSYGCHENYSLLRYDERGRDVFTRLPDDLLPFLVTRQLFCGAGRIGSRQPQPHASAGFQLSQRADFIEQLFSSTTRDERSLINLRDEPLAEKQRWRRLHLILGDSNISPIATFLKLGTTGLVLRLVEDNLINGRWALRDPVAAFQAISRLTQTALPLQRGGSLTALEIQRAYWLLASEQCSRQPATGFAHQILELWGKVLDDLAHHPARLARRLDWAIKRDNLFSPVLREAVLDWEELGCWYYVVEQTKEVPFPPLNSSSEEWLKQHLPAERFRQINDYRRAKRLDWRHYGAGRQLLNKLCEMDLRYHDIHPRTSLYRRMSGRLDVFPSDDQEIALAQQQPPVNTRAWQRGQMITLSHERELTMEMDWDKVLIPSTNRLLPMPDPFAPVQIRLDQVPELTSRDLEAPSHGLRRPPLVTIVRVERLE